jgi:hypothetical protein
MHNIFATSSKSGLSNANQGISSTRVISAFAAIRSVLLLGVLGCVSSAEAHAEGQVQLPNKTGYTLFNPTPKDHMRELSTDRPDQTESAYTVDAGHFQIEMDFLNYTYDHDQSGGGDVRTKDLNVAPLNLKVGLLNQVDLQLLFDPYIRSKTEDHITGIEDKVSGFGDVTTRLKINFWGNDGGKTAFAMMPFVKWPLSASDVRNGKTEGGVIFILGYELPAGWGSAVMTEVDFISDGLGGHDSEFVNSITFGRDITENIGGYIEFFTVTGNAPGFKWQGQLDIGFTYAVSDNIQLDWGCNFGVTKSAPDYQPFVGFSQRF